MKQHSISVVIPTMNRGNSLKQTVDNLLKSDILPMEIIVVDQSQDKNMVDETREFMASLSLKTRCIFLETPSLTKARNVGLQEVTGDIVVFMDDDVDVRYDTLSNVDAAFCDSKVAMVAGLFEGYDNANRSKLGFLFGKKSWSKRKIGHVTRSMFGRFPERVHGVVETEWCMGFFSVFRTELIRKWGMKWDEHLTGYAYAEDLDFSYGYYKHAKAEGMKGIMSENIIVRHNVSQEYRIPTRRHTFMVINNRRYLSRKHFGVSVRSTIAMLWSDSWEYVRRQLKHEAPKDWLDAMLGRKM